MIKEIDTIRKTREYLLELVKELSVEQLNEVPSGFNNNIIWNLAHLTAAQQGVCYIRAGIKPVVDEKYVTPYRSGTKPEQFVDESEVAAIKKILLSSLESFNKDYDDKLFENYLEWSTRYGVTLRSIDDAVGFLGYHEGLHAGYIMALKRVVTK